MTIHTYGWNETWDPHLPSDAFPEGIPARVIAEHRELYRVHTGTQELPARVSGRLRHLAASLADLPAVGDWVLIEPTEAGSDAVIHVVLPRATQFSRKAAGTRTDEQVVAANVDTVWIVSAFGYDLNPARIDRYVSLVWQGGASPVVVLTKSDLAEYPDVTVAELEERVVAVPVHAVSSVSGSGLEALHEYLVPGRTIALLGSSGVGKSTLLNRLCGREVMQVSEVRSGQGKGRHKTSHRQLVLLPTGALLLDTPGMRELQLWNADDGVGKSFEDIEALAAQCRFADCTHQSEPGCAVRAAVEKGDLPADRLTSFSKLRDELAYLDRKQDKRAEIEEQRKWREIAKVRRRINKGRD
ncbi:ribosome small subunit-dependent GTPase A [Candidatus Latescibacterota bacterium]